MKIRESEAGGDSECSVEIRRATLDDAEGILRCLQTAFEPYRQNYSTEAFEDTVLTPETLRARLEDMVAFVALANGSDVIGTIACKAISADEGHLRGMAVLLPWRGRGVALQLLQRAERELANRGCKRTTLDTTEPLRPAIRFYEKHGYRASGKVVDFYGMPLFEYVRELR